MLGQGEQEELETFDIEFDERVHSSALRDILPPPLLAFPEDFEMVWTDIGTGSKLSLTLRLSMHQHTHPIRLITGGFASIKKYGEVSIWRPLPPKSRNLFFGYDSLHLVLMSDYEDYIVLGHLASPDRNSKPSTTCMACVRRSAVIPTTQYKYPGESSINNSGFLWTDRFSGGRTDCSLWVAEGEDGISVASTTFVSTKGYRPPQAGSFWAFPISE